MKRKQFFYFLGKGNLKNRMYIVHCTIPGEENVFPFFLKDLLT